MRLIRTLLSLACAIGFLGRVAQAELTWDFDTGDGTTPTLDGWIIISNGDPGIDGQPLIQVEGSERNRLPNAPVLTTSWDRDGQAGGFIGDSAHPPLVARSPSFVITSATSITWQDVGGHSGLAPQLNAGVYDTGAQGLALVRASDAQMITSVAANVAAIIDIGILGIANDGIPYYLEAVDTRSGGWGYVEWDDITVPGMLHSLTWDFDTGDGTTPTLDGWTIISNGDPGIDGQPLIQVEGSERNRLPNAPVLTTSWDRDGQAGGFIGDSAHPPLVARSPSFVITSATSITWQDVGGHSGLAPQLNAGVYDTGAQGLALVRASDAQMITSVAANVAAIIDIGILGIANDGIPYYLEAVDTRSGGWGYVEWDDITVPGMLHSLGPPLFLNIERNGSVLNFSWPSRDGNLYRLWSSANANDPIASWIMVAEDIPANAPNGAMSMPQPEESRLLFRLEEYE